MVAEEQCPTCEFQSYTPRCGKDRARILQNEVSGFFKSITCLLYQKKIPKSAMVDLPKCPTCGQFVYNRTVLTGEIGNLGGEIRVYVGSPPEKPTDEIKGKPIVTVKIPKRSSGNKRPRRKGTQNGGSQGT